MTIQWKSCFISLMKQSNQSWALLILILSKFYLLLHFVLRKQYNITCFWLKLHFQSLKILHISCIKPLLKIYVNVCFLYFLIQQIIHSKTNWELVVCSQFIHSFLTQNLIYSKLSFFQSRKCSLIRRQVDIQTGFLCFWRHLNFIFNWRNFISTSWQYIHFQLLNALQVLSIIIIIIYSKIQHHDTHKCTSIQTVFKTSNDNVLVAIVFFLSIT